MWDFTSWIISRLPTKASNISFSLSLSNTHTHTHGSLIARVIRKHTPKEVVQSSYIRDEALLLYLGGYRIRAEEIQKRLACPRRSTFSEFHLRLLKAWRVPWQRRHKVRVPWCSSASFPPEPLRGWAAHSGARHTHTHTHTQRERKCIVPVRWRKITSVPAANT